MALTRTERKVLERARKMLVSGESRFVCFAIRSAGVQIQAHRAADRLRAYVRRSLDGLATLELWQYERGIQHSETQVHADRIAWIDGMLDQ